MGLKRAIAGNICLILTYYLAAKLSWMLSLPPTGATPLWIPAGIALGAVLVWGYRLLPSVFIAGCALVVMHHGGNDAISLSVLGIGYGLQAALHAATGRFLLGRFGVWPSALVREFEIIRFFLLSAFVLAVVPAVVVVAFELGEGDISTHSLLNTILTWWVGNALGVIIFTPIMLIVFAQPRVIWQPRIFSVAIPMLLLFVLTDALLMMTRDRALNSVSQEFESDVRVVNSIIRSELDYHQLLLRSMHAYFKNSEYVSDAEFMSYLKDFSDYHKDVSAVAWIESVAADKRQQFEKNNHLRITQINPANGMASLAHKKASYLVVKYLQSLNGATLPVAELLGLDVCSTPMDMKVCRQLTSGTETTYLVSSLLPFSIGSKHELAIVLPVKNEQKQMIGMVMNLIDKKQMFANHAIVQASKWLTFSVHDLTSNREVFVNSTRSQNIMYPHTHAITRQIRFGGHLWRVTYRPSPLILSALSLRTFYWVAVASLVILTVIVIWLMSMSARLKLIEQEVRLKTRQLNDHAQKLTESEAKYRRLVENVQEDYFLYTRDEKGRLTYVSPSVTDLLGFSQDEIIAKMRDFMPDTPVNLQVDGFIEQVLAGKPVKFELQIISKSGQLHTLDVSETPSYNDADEIAGVEGIAHDITELRKSQIELEKLSLAVEHSPNAVVIMDKKGIIEYINPKFSAITGYSMEEAVGKWPDLINSGKNAPETYQEIWQTILSGNEWRGELQNRKKNGDLYWAQELIAPMLNDDGEVTHFVATQVDVTEARRLQEETSYQATHDLLTGLINRREFDSRLKRVISSAKRDLSEHALCFMDLDQFKVVNDTCGHLAGDELLRQIGRLLENNIRSRDTVARIGGDEFAILMEHCSIEQAYKTCEALLQLLQDFRFHWEGYSFKVGASIGLTIIDQFTKDSNDALKNVDNACYAAKDAGRNRVEIHTEDSERLQQRRGEIEWNNEINDALDKDRFMLFVQAIKPLRDESLSLSYEILLRLKMRDGSVVSPGSFLPAAERFNVITRIDRWVVHNALDWISQHMERLQHIATMSINLSGLSLSDASITGFIIEQIRSTRVPAEKIKFEITETSAISNLQAATEFIDTLRDAGVSFALDDFGSGLSSFAYLKNLRIDSLKIDGMFVKDILDDPLDYEMVKSINEIGHVMGLRTIAEYVDKPEIIEKLRKIGVDFMQGYAVGKPMPIDELLNNE